MEFFPFLFVARVGEFAGADDGGFEFAQFVEARQDGGEEPAVDAAGEGEEEESGDAGPFAEGAFGEEPADADDAQPRADDAGEVVAGENHAGEFAGMFGGQGAEDGGSDNSTEEDDAAGPDGQRQ